MRDDLSVKNLVGRTERDAWSPVTGSRPESYRIPEVGIALMEKVDYALFKRDLDGAITAGVILQKWADHVTHFRCKAPAVMAAVYAVCGIRDEAEKKLVAAKDRACSRQCLDCQAEYLKRNGTFLLYETRYESAYSSYSSSSDLFLDLGNRRQAGISIMSRGATAFLLHRYDEALRDHERALELLGDEPDMNVIMASANIAAIYTYLGRVDRALRQIEVTQEMLKGEGSAERPRLILRWIRSLLLEAQNKFKDAGEMLDRVEARMRRLEMKPELRMVLADRARIARRPDAIRRIARKASALEAIPRIRTLIETAMEAPTRENVLTWRSALNSYVPPFSATA